MNIKICYSENIIAEIHYCDYLLMSIIITMHTSASKKTAWRQWGSIKDSKEYWVMLTAVQLTSTRGCEVHYPWSEYPDSGGSWLNLSSGNLLRVAGSTVKSSFYSSNHTYKVLVISNILLSYCKMPSSLPKKKNLPMWFYVGEKDWYIYKLIHVTIYNDKCTQRIPRNHSLEPKPCLRQLVPVRKCYLFSNVPRCMHQRPHVLMAKKKVIHKRQHFCQSVDVQYRTVM